MTSIPKWLMRRFQQGMTTADQEFPGGKLAYNPDANFSLCDNLVREALQNPKDARLSKSHPARVDFRIVAMSMNDFARLFDFQAFLDHISRATPNSYNDKGRRWLKQIQKWAATTAEVQFLIVSDRNTVGLNGSIASGLQRHNRFYRAQLSVPGSGDKGQGESGTSGGVGVGLGGLREFSLLRILGAYTHFQEHADDDPARKGNEGATDGHRSRFMLKGILHGHTVGNDEYTGHCHLALPNSNGGVEPLANHAAEDFWHGFANTVGEPDLVRQQGDFGTDSIIVAPKGTDMMKLKAVAEKWFWPGMLDGDLDVRFHVPGNGVIAAEPDKNVALTPFIDARNAMPSGKPIAVNFAGANYAAGNVGIRDITATERLMLDGQDGRPPANSTALVRDGMVINYVLDMKAGIEAEPASVAVYEPDGTGLAGVAHTEICAFAEPDSHSDWNDANGRLNAEHGHRLNGLKLGNASFSGYMKRLLDAVLTVLATHLDSNQNQGHDSGASALNSALSKLLSDNHGRGPGPTPPPPPNPPQEAVIFIESVPNRRGHFTAELKATPITSTVPKTIHLDFVVGLRTDNGDRGQAVRFKAVNAASGVAASNNPKQGQDEARLTETLIAGMKPAKFNLVVSNPGHDREFVAYCTGDI